jgi:hypothetical protein
MPKQQMTEQELYSKNIYWLLDVGGSASIIQNGVYLNFYWLSKTTPVYK